MDSLSRRSLGGSAGMDRREFLRAAGAGGLALGAAASPLSALAAQQDAASKPKARSVIQIGIWGGMSQFETFDPKPNAAFESRSFFKPIPTNVSGIEICETLPMLAKNADKYAILRSMINPYTGHSTCLTVILSNSMPPGGTASSHPSANLVYPGVGAVVALKLCEQDRYQGDLPPWISIGRAMGAPGEGFLGPKWKPFNVSSRGRSRRGGADQRLAERRDLLAAIEPQASGAGGLRPPASEAVSTVRDDMFRVMSSEAQDVLDLEQEKPDVRERYGDNEFGQSLLLARRLVEYGLPFVSILTSGNVRGKNGKRYGWDMHEQLNDSIRALCPILDQSLSALLEDLSEKGLLDETIVVLAPENGKGPDFNTKWKKGGPHPGEKGGRQHWGNGYSCVVAGGGFQGGKTVGAMDDDGRMVVSRPIYPWDMWESAYLLLGIDPNDTLPNPSGCVAPVSQATACSLPRGGILTEIM